MQYVLHDNAFIRDGLSGEQLEVEGAEAAAKVEAAAAVWRWLAPIDDEGLAELASISPLEVLGTTTIAHMHMHPLRFQRQPGEGCDAMQCTI